MKVFRTIAKIVFALAAIAGAVYIAATYGDRIVAWAKKLVNCHCICDCDCDCDCDCECECDEVADTAADAVPTASESDFEG